MPNVNKAIAYFKKYFWQNPNCYLIIATVLSYSE